MRSCWELSFELNDSYSLGEDTRKATGEIHRCVDWYPIRNGSLHPALCATCGERLQKEVILEELLLRRDDFDLSETYEGDLIASTRGKDFLSEVSSVPLTFSELPRSKGFHWLNPMSVATVAVDVDRSGIRMSDRCEKCGGYCEVLYGMNPGPPPQAMPIYVACGELANGFYRTDIELGSGFSKSPLFLIGLDSAEHLKARGLTGVEPSDLQVYSV